MSFITRMAYFVSLIVFFASSAWANIEDTTDSEQLKTAARQTQPAKQTAKEPSNDSLDAQIVKLRTDWAIAKFQTPKNKQIPEFEQLIQRAQALYQKYPNNPEVLTWYATILSTYSSLKGGLGVLPHLKKAKALLEQAINLNSRIENGLAYGVLGAIYARVPGWPIAFGSKDKARSYLQMAVKISPQGSDSNYYYGDFLVDTGNYEEGRRHLEIAQKAPVRKGYEIQDRGRKSEIAASLAKLQRLGH
ncbi:MAG: tetratricopeptide repeat protein [Candidatus Berkiella sp.]